MRVFQFDNLSTFAERVTPLLMEREAENCFLLGRLCELATAREDGSNSMWSVEADDGRVVAAALMSPRRDSIRRHPLVVTRASADAIGTLIDHLLAARVDLPGVSAPEPTVDEFAEAWCAGTGRGRRVAVALGLHRLTRVVPPLPIGGSFRAATANESVDLVSWAEAFFRDVNEPESRAFCEKTVASRIREGRLSLWCDPHPVSMAGWSGRTPNAARVNFVYSPAEHRGRGYASACVAALSQELLDSGRKFCTLFTDMGNPTSNKIYKSVGYEQVCNFKHVDFV